MNDKSVIHTLLLAMEHLSYRPARQAVGEYYYQTADGEYVPASEGHRQEAVRLIAQARRQLAEEATDE